MLIVPAIRMSPANVGFAGSITSRAVYPVGVNNRGKRSVGTGSLVGGACTSRGGARPAAELAGGWAGGWPGGWAGGWPGGWPGVTGGGGGAPIQPAMTTTHSARHGAFLADIALLADIGGR